MIKALMIGRPNVGKSTLYNKLLRRKSAITYNTPGVTKDILESVCKFNGKPFVLMDAAGFDFNTEHSISRIEYAIKEADVIIFITDHEVTDEDYVIAKWLRKNTNAPIILAINKCDKKISLQFVNTFGFENSIRISAEHGLGLMDLCDMITEFDQSEEPQIEDQDGIRLVIVGRPNVGKSTFVNNMLKKERVLTDDAPGTTRDSVHINWKHNDNLFTLVDTAGIRKRAQVHEVLESASVKKSFESIRQADVVLFMCDIENTFLEKQDFIILNKITEEGKPIIIVANKADKVDNPDELLKEFGRQCSNYIGHNIPLVSFFIF